MQPKPTHPLTHTLTPRPHKHTCRHTRRHNVFLCMVQGEMTMDVVGTCAFGVQLRTQEVEKEGTEDARALINAARSIFQLGKVAFDVN
jgi:hypothetical protein